MPISYLNQPHIREQTRRNHIDCSILVWIPRHHLEKKHGRYSLRLCYEKNSWNQISSIQGKNMLNIFHIRTKNLRFGNDWSILIIIMFDGCEFKNGRFIICSGIIPMLFNFLHLMFRFNLYCGTIVCIFTNFLKVRISECISYKRKYNLKKKSVKMQSIPLSMS